MKGRRSFKTFNIFSAIAAIALAACLILTFAPFPTPAYANSAQKYFDGVDATGAMMRGDSPIVVEDETLAFDLRDFPLPSYDSNEQFLSYGGKVTATYAFFNPSEFTVTSTLCFPFGKLPSYAPDYYDGGSDDAHKYAVTLNQQSVEAKLRHTFSYPYESFDVERDLDLLTDGYVEDDFFSPDLPVVKYSCVVLDIEQTSDMYYPCAALDIVGDDGPRVYFPGINSMNTLSNGVYRVGKWAEVGDELIVYAFGANSAQDGMPKWKFFLNGGLEDSDETQGTTSEIVAETMTFEEFALFGRSDENDADISKTDWYNAIVTQLKNERKTDECPAVDLVGYGYTLRQNLLRWYEYEIVFAPGERVLNSITAPIYPTIESNFDPPKYNYTYLLSPAKTWSDFGTLEITINTPYFLLGNSSDFSNGFQKTDDGYKLTSDGLPSGELTFTLCASEDPVAESGSIAGVMIAIAMLLAAIFGAALQIVGFASGGIVSVLLIALFIVRPVLDVVGAIVILICLGVKRAKRKKAFSSSSPSSAENKSPDLLSEGVETTSDNIAVVANKDADEFPPETEEKPCAIPSGGEGISESASESAPAREESLTLETLPFDNAQSDDALPNIRECANENDPPLAPKNEDARSDAGDIAREDGVSYPN